MCNCGIKADSYHLLESLAACDNRLTKLTMYFTINLAFSNHLELMPNNTDQLTINRGKTNHEQPLPVYLNILHSDNSLSDRPGKLKVLYTIMYKVQITKKFLNCKKAC